MKETFFFVWWRRDGEEGHRCTAILTSRMEANRVAGSDDGKTVLTQAERLPFAAEALFMAPRVELHGRQIWP